MYERLSQFTSHIVTLGIIKDVKLHDPKKIAELEKFVIKSTAGHGCSFGIETNHLFESKKGGESNLNVKKLDKLENELEKLMRTVSNEGYLKSASPKVQAKHSEKVSVWSMFCLVCYSRYRKLKTLILPIDQTTQNRN